MFSGSSKVRRSRPVHRLKKTDESTLHTIMMLIVGRADVSLNVFITRVT